jgi:hypothetical protein
MPGRDGTGPTGAGPMTGRCKGFCSGSMYRRSGFGHGFGRGYFYGMTSDTKEQAAKYLPDLMEYLEHNEDINKWKDIKPLATVKQENSVCALFTGKYENTPVTLRWFYEFEMPKFRMDYGFSDNGVRDDECMRRYDIGK